MRKGGHRLQSLEIGLKLLKPVTYLLNHLIQCCQGQIRELFFAQLLAIDVPPN